MLLGLRTAIYPVADIEAAKAWYTRLLETPPYFDQSFYVGFSVGGFELELTPGGANGTSGAQPLWGVASIETAYARLLELGAVALDPIADVGEGIKVAAVRDPFGNRLGIIENPTFDRSAVR